MGIIKFVFTKKFQNSAQTGKIRTEHFSDEYLKQVTTAYIQTNGNFYVGTVGYTLYLNQALLSLTQLFPILFIAYKISQPYR